MANEIGNPGELVQVVLDKIMSSTDVQTLVGQRVYGAHPVDPESSLRQGPILVFEVVGDQDRYAGQIQNVFCHLYAWSSESRSMATRAYHAAAVALHAERLKKTGLAIAGYARRVGGPLDGFHQASRSWWVRGDWQVIAAGEGDE